MRWTKSQNPEENWHSAAELPRGTPGSGLASSDGCLLIQDERRVRIVLSSPDGSGNRQITKIYRTPIELTWRDLFRYPQAQREFDNLQYAFQRGLPVVEPLGWALRRRPGREWFSELTIAFLEGDTLNVVLNRPGVGKALQEELARETGKLMASMHCQGLIWGTAHGGNIMVLSQADPSLVAIDLPYAMCSAKDMCGTRYALYDVWSIANDCRKACQLEKYQVDLLLAAYAAGAGTDPGPLRRQVESIPGRNSFFWDRVRVRTLQSFRIRPW